METEKKREISVSEDLRLSLSPLEPEQPEEERQQAIIVTPETVNLLSAEFNSSTDCDLVILPDMPTREVDGHNDDDADVLIIDLTDKERAEMESWGK